MPDQTSIEECVQSLTKFNRGAQSMFTLTISLLDVFEDNACRVSVFGFRIFIERLDLSFLASILVPSPRLHRDTAEDEATN